MRHSGRIAIIAVVGSAALALAATAAAFGARFGRRMREPDASPRAFQRRGGRAAATRTVLVCAGDSITHGVMSADYPAMLAERLGADGVEVVNAGINGNLAWNVLARLDDVIACRPDVVTLLIGTNDVLATIDDAWAARYDRDQHLPQTPTIAWYRECVASILDRLTAETNARVAVMDLPPLGEDLDSDINGRVAAYSEVLREAAAERGVPVLPLHERLVGLLPANQDAQAFSGDTALMLRAAFRHEVLRQSWNQVSAAHGLRVLTDQVHLNDDAAAVIADLVAGFVRGG